MAGERAAKRPRRAQTVKRDVYEADVPDLPEETSRRYDVRIGISKLNLSALKHSSTRKLQQQYSCFEVPTWLLSSIRRFCGCPRQPRHHTR